MKINVNGDILTAHLDGEIDHHSAPSVRNTVDEAVFMHSPKKLILDFSDITFMDSSGVGLIMGRYKLLSGKNGTVEVRDSKNATSELSKCRDSKNLLKSGEKI